MRIVFSLLLLYFSQFPVTGLAQTPLRKHIHDLIQVELKRQNQPELNSQDYSDKFSKELPAADIKAAVASINRVLPAHLQFSLMAATSENVNMDSKNRMIVYDPNTIRFLSDGRSIVLAAIIAHEMGHYFYDVVKATGGEIIEVAPHLPGEDIDHAWVESVACEILHLSGYSDAEIREAFEGLHKQTDAVIESLVGPNNKSTDINSRRAAVARWLSGQ